MMDKIMSLVKDQVSKTITEKVNVPADKQQAAVETTTSSIIDGLKEHINPSNIGEIMSMFGSGGGASSSLASSAIGKGVESSVISGLTSKVGLNPSLASAIASMVVPAVISMLTKKAAGKDDNSFDIGSLLQSFSGGKKDAGTSSGGSMMDMLGGLLGNKGK